MSVAQGLSIADWVVVGAYLAAILGMSFFIARRQRLGDDFFLAGRSMRGGILAMSIMANQVSAVSLVGAPAFVALREGGGLRWLQYELALPLAMLLLIAVLLPLVRSVPGASIYEWAGTRFGRGTRRALAGAFVLSRGLAVGVIVYASALVVAPVFGISVAQAVVFTGAFSVLYCTMGGIVADIWSDVLQLVILWGGVLLSIAFLIRRDGMRLVDAIPLDRSTTIVVDSFGLTDGNSFALAPMLIGGLFLYLSYYGCDQSQAQRLLAARDDASARMSLVLNGVLRFPLVMTYCVFGLLLAALLRTDASFAAHLAGQPPDALVPTFLIHYLPAGARGLLLASIFAAAMSSIDSALNSLAAVTLDDVAGVDATRQPAWSGRLATLGWGLFAIASALFFAGGTTGILELITQIGSLFYGPILAVFLAGAMLPGVENRGALAGLAAGFATNVAAAQLLPGMSWLWWNPIGCLSALLVAVMVSGFRVKVAWHPIPRRAAVILLPAFAAILIMTALLPRLLSR
jgi:SSS family solute:Na+ symporter